MFQPHPLKKTSLWQESKPQNHSENISEKDFLVLQGLWKYLLIIIIYTYMLLLYILGFELRALSLQGKYSTT
jgi:hypothetical protein